VTEGNGILARLGDVIYWLFSGLALMIVFVIVSFFFGFDLSFVGDGFGTLETPDEEVFPQIFLVPLVIWLIGRGVRYITSGR